MPFQSRLQLQLEGKNLWSTLSPLIYESLVAKITVTVPAEFFTDLASVPRLPLAYLITGGRVPGPATVHDWLYQSPDWNDRGLADAIILEAMACEQPDLGFEAESSFIRGLIWSGVRAGGWHAWNNDKRVVTLNPEWSATTWPKLTEAP